MVRQDTVTLRYDAADTLISMLHAVDARDWTGVRRAFSDEVDVDYSALTGAPPARVAADAMVAGWRSFLGAFDATQHLTGPILVSTDAVSATARTHVRAYHRTTRDALASIWLVAGHYDVRLDRAGERWRITAMTLRVFYQEGGAAQV
jgi:hypothetical protein